MNRLVIQKPDNKKEVITDCFEKHFKHYGFKKTSVNDVSSELKMSKKTIYNFFSTKEEIFYYVVSRVARKIGQDMEKNLEDCRTSEEKLIKLMSMIFTQSKEWLKNNDAFEFKYKYELAALAFKESQGELTKKVLQEGITSGEFKISNVDITMCFIKGIISESMRLLSANPKLNIESETVKSIFKLIK
ncbi:MAG: TetR/AcrR family transcriptional regulator [Clostridiales bacterium]|nr:TetR/AcrR family transcriptional regulator [Clostridiales bacterium]